MSTAGEQVAPAPRDAAWLWQQIRIEAERMARDEPMLASLGFKMQRPFLRMSLGEAPAFDASLNFGITGPEFA